MILIDARKGVLTQTRRHSYLVSLLGIRHVVLAINKMDLVDYSQEVVRRRSSPTTATSPRRSASRTSPRSRCRRCAATTSPSAQRRHALVRRPDADGLPRDGRGRRRRCRQQRRSGMPVQWVNRPNLDFRGFAGTIASGAVKPGRHGARPAVRPREHASRASSPSDGDLTERRRRPVGHADARRRDRRHAAATCCRRRRSPPEVADQFEAHHRLDGRRADAAGPALPG